jgi:hypothetical protein
LFRIGQPGNAGMAQPLQEPKEREDRVLTARGLAANRNLLALVQDGVYDTFAVDDAYNEKLADAVEEFTESAPVVKFS